MAGYTIYTNNPKVQERYPDNSAYYTTSARELMSAVRNAVHKGAVIVSNPLSGGLKPALNPFKSIILRENKGQLDFTSLKLIEETQAFYKKNGMIQYRSYNDKMLEDFQVLDLSLMVSAMAGLQEV
jgi:hypothetical protein